MLLGFLLKGMLVGIVIALPAGPVGVLCIRRTIFHGRLAGFISGLGASTADAVFGIIAGFGLTVVSDWLLGYQDWLRLGGAGFLIYIGVSAFTGDPRAGRVVRLAAVVGGIGAGRRDGADVVWPRPSGLDQPRLGRDISVVRG